MRPALGVAAGVVVLVAIFTYVTVHPASKERSDTKYESVVLQSKDGTQTAAAFFAGKSKRAAVFVPGAVFNKESWYFLAERLQQLEIASLSLDGKQPVDVLSAVDFLKKRRFEKIALVGGSMGGAAVLDALREGIEDSVDEVVVLAPFGGDPIKNKKIRKLFVVAKEDSLGAYSPVHTLYEDSSEPKVMKVYEGSEHAQHLFKSKHKEDLIQLIVNFISQVE